MHWQKILLVMLLTGALELWGAAEGTVKAESLTVRAQPTAQSVSLGAFKKGDKIKILSSAKGWFRVTLPADTPVWISADLVADGKIRVRRANLRSSSSTDSAVVGQADQNTAVEVLDNSVKDWLKIKCPPSVALTGYVNASFVDAAKDAGGETADPVKPLPTDNSKDKFAELREHIKGQKPREVTIVGALSPLENRQSVMGIEYYIFEFKGEGKEPLWLGFLYGKQNLKSFEGKKIKVRANRYTIDGWDKPVFEVISVVEQ